MLHVYVNIGEKKVELELQESSTALEVLKKAGIYEKYDAPCGGRGICRRCLALIDGTEQLLCQTQVKDGTLIELTGSKDLALTEESGFSFSFDKGKTGLGVAVDIGTTTVAVYLYDLADGTCLGRTGEGNAQQAFGADVISRIKYCIDKPNGTDEMCAAIRKQISRMVESLCTKAGKSSAQIHEICVAGNTTMEHIFAGISPKAMAKAPFIPETLFGKDYSAKEFGINSAEDAVLHICGCISGFVGGDISAGLAYVNATEEEKTILFVDIGTNGEMALGNKNGILCCSTAAGPAFEGASISCGMNAADGAIDSVYLEDGHFAYSVINEGRPAGICGSGLIDLLACLIETGVVDECGRLLPAEEAPEEYSHMISGEGKNTAFSLCEGVSVTAEDIRKLQLAKAAIDGGIRTLLEYAGIKPNAIDKFYIAGGFGNYIKLKSAETIGLFDKTLISRAVVVGNTSGAGAAMAILSENGKKRLEKACEKCNYIELSGMEMFNRNYMEAMFFES